MFSSLKKTGYIMEKQLISFPKFIKGFIMSQDIETAFRETQELQSLVWLRYINDIFFIWTHGQQEIQTFLRSLSNFHTDIKFTYE